jgi:hypothetical protein
VINFVGYFKSRVLKYIIWLNFILIATLVRSQTPSGIQDTIYFKYDHNGLYPTEYSFSKDTLNSIQIYENVKYMLEFANEILNDFEGKIVNENKGKSFTLKGKFASVFCHDFIGKVCSDGLLEVDFIFKEGSFTMKPIKIKRSVDLEKIPISGRAFFYKKDNTLLKRFSSFPTAIENMLNWLAFFSSLEPTEK